MFCSQRIMLPMWQITRKTGAKTLPAVRLSTRAFPNTVGVRSLCTSPAFRNIVKSDVADQEQPTGNLVNTVFENVTKWGSKTAVECSVTGRNYTYNQLLDYISKWAGFLINLGMQKGDVMAIYMPNCPEYPIALLGAISIGIIPTPINPKYTAEEFVKQVSDSKAQVLVGDPGVETAIIEGINRYKKPLHIVMNGPTKVPGALNMLDILSDATIPHADTVQVKNEDIVMLPYSSGTTGPPKGVVLSHGAFSINIHMCMHNYFCLTEEATDSSQEAYVGLLPFYHVSGVLCQMMAGFYKGAKVVTMAQMEPNNFVDTISNHKVGILHLVPPLINFVLHSPLATAEKLASVRVIPVGAAPVYPSAVEALRQKLKRNVFFQELYGMTEILIASMVPADQEKIGTSGKLLPNVTAKIIDTATGDLLPSSSTGEICLKSPATMTGYFNNDEATSATVDKDGWVHTGDVGFFDEEGYMKIVDRTKELIKVKGLQVSPSELEEILRQHPQVLDVGVVGIPHERSGEVPRAYVVTKSKISADDIHSFLDNRVAPHKKLSGGVVFVDELPKTNTGKILRKDLKKMAMG
ncbi:hypothetical protein SK128_006952 [Halocaridina rubra]|uniref:4-coumarate--CoA ligase n=1 Tax=Halocaridina rubra TaxID=373956 RepID=A0AAN8X8U7_HALRR